MINQKLPAFHYRPIKVKPEFQNDSVMTTLITSAVLEMNEPNLQLIRSAFPELLPMYISTDTLRFLKVMRKENIQFADQELDLLLQEV